MTRTVIAIALLVGALSSALAGSGDRYRVAAIPADLRVSARAVVRHHLERFNVRGREHATYVVHKAVTVFERDDRRYGELLIWYGRNTDIEDLEGRIYDGEGNEVRRLKDEDILDLPAVDGATFYSDSRVRIARLYHHQYPYTVEFRYEVEYDGFINWPRWYAQRYPDAVEHSRFEVSTPYPLRFWCNSDSVKPVTTARGASTEYVWEARNIPRIPMDLYGDIEDVTPMVLIAPETFSLEGYSGSMATWSDFGRWYGKLSEGKDNLPADALAEVKALIKSEDGLEARARAVYRYMQSRTRYVSVQLGIGGWQPFDARYVHERGYGDCKALTNYMKALLASAGIDSYPVLVYNGSTRYPMIPEFPSSQFNHVILCVPAGQDSLWLECTSQSLPAGRIGSGNENRHALLVGPEGGVVVRTPASTASQNRQERLATVRLFASGEAEAGIVTTYTGNQGNRVRGNLDGSSAVEQSQWIMTDLQFPHVNLRSFSVQGLTGGSPDVTIETQVSIPRFVNKSGDRIFFRPNLTERIRSAPAAHQNRVSPIRMSYAYEDRDSILYRLPPDFTVEALPETVRQSSAFGSFHSAVTTLGDTAVSYVRHLKIDRTQIPVEDLASYRAFFTAAFHADRAQVVLISRWARRR